MEPESTAMRLLRLLRDGPRTAQSLAARLDRDVSSVRRHLEILRGQGAVACDDHVEGPGRPKRRYRLTGPGWESFPRDYALLATLLLKALQERVGRDHVEAAYQEVAAQLAAQVAGRTVHERLTGLDRLYNQLGFEASIERDKDASYLVQRNCPFLQMAKADPGGVCHCLDQGIMGAVLPEAVLSLERCMASGDGLCRHRIQVR